MASFCFIPRDSSPGSDASLFGQIHFHEQSWNPIADVGHSVQPADESQMLLDREVLEEMRLIRNEGQRGLGAHWIPSQIVARDPDLVQRSG